MCESYRGPQVTAVPTWEKSGCMYPQVLLDTLMSVGTDDAALDRHQNGQRFGILG